MATHERRFYTRSYRLLDWELNVSTHAYVGYVILPARRGNEQMLFSNQALTNQEKRIQDFLAKTPNAQLLKTFMETGDHQKHRHRWPRLQEAIQYCKEHQAHLVIGEIRNLSGNETFSELIFELFNDENKSNFKTEIYCCDQPLITRENFAVLVEHAKKQKELHGQLIKAGLSRTTAKSGNPHAADVISKVNKPKIDNAIVFALMLQPVINDYHAKGYSQRKMVSRLNEEGFTAPEGGPWVLSQLQKVLDRIKMNESALTLEKQLIEYRSRKMNDKAIAELLNKLSVPPPKGDYWDLETVEKVSERVKQIHDIIRFNEFVIELMPILSKYHIDELTEDVFTQELQMIGVNIPRPPENINLNGERYDQST